MKSIANFQGPKQPLAVDVVVGRVLDRVAGTRRAGRVLAGRVVAVRFFRDGLVLAVAVVGFFFTGLISGGGLQSGGSFRQSPAGA